MPPRTPRPLGSLQRPRRNAEPHPGTSRRSPTPRRPTCQSEILRRHTPRVASLPFIPNAAFDRRLSSPTPGLMRLGDGGLSIFQYSPAIAKPPETRALPKLTTAETRRSGSCIASPFSMSCRTDSITHQNLRATQRIDQLVQLVQHVLHLRRVVAAIGSLAQRAHAIRVVARAVDRAVELGITHLTRRALAAIAAIVSQLALAAITRSATSRRLVFVRLLTCSTVISDKTAHLAASKMDEATRNPIFFESTALNRLLSSQRASRNGSSLSMGVKKR